MDKATVFVLTEDKTLLLFQKMAINSDQCPLCGKEGVKRRGVMAICDICAILKKMVRCARCGKSFQVNHRATEVHKGVYPASFLGDEGEPIGIITAACRACDPGEKMEKVDHFVLTLNRR